MNDLNSIKKILRATPTNMRRLVSALHSEGFTVLEAFLDEDGDPEITIEPGENAVADGKRLTWLIAKWGVQPNNAIGKPAMNVSYVLDPTGEFTEAAIRLYEYTDDDFTALPPLTIDIAFTPAQIEAAARAAHEVNRSYCEVGGDTSRKSWAEAPNWQCQSVLEGVRDIIDGKTPEQIHESWMSWLISCGWRYGEVEDAEEKTHPHIVPYDSLPEFQRRKDELFRETVCAVLGIDIT